MNYELTNIDLLVEYFTRFKDSKEIVSKLFKKDPDQNEKDPHRGGNLVYESNPEKKSHSLKLSLRCPDNLDILKETSPIETLIRSINEDPDLTDNNLMPLFIVSAEDNTIRHRNSKKIEYSLSLTDKVLTITSKYKKSLFSRSRNLKKAFTKTIQRYNGVLEVIGTHCKCDGNVPEPEEWKLINGTEITSPIIISTKPSEQKQEPEPAIYDQGIFLQDPKELKTNSNILMPEDATSAIRSNKRPNILFVGDLKEASKYATNLIARSSEEVLIFDRRYLVNIGLQDQLRYEDLIKASLEKTKRAKIELWGESTWPLRDLMEKPIQLIGYTDDFYRTILFPDSKWSEIINLRDFITEQYLDTLFGHIKDKENSYVFFRSEKHIKEAFLQFENLPTYFAKDTLEKIAKKARSEAITNAGNPSNKKLTIPNYTFDLEFRKTKQIIEKIQYN